MNRRSFLSWMPSGFLAIYSLWKGESSQAKVEDVGRSLQDPPTGPSPWWYGCKVLFSFPENLHAKPNSYQGSKEFVESIVRQWEESGTVLIWKVRNGFGGITELHVLPTSCVVPIPPCSNFPDGSYGVHYAYDFCQTIPAKDVDRILLARCALEYGGKEEMERVDRFYSNNQVK